MRKPKSPTKRPTIPITSTLGTEFQLPSSANIVLSSASVGDTPPHAQTFNCGQASPNHPCMHTKSVSISSVSALDINYCNRRCLTVPLRRRRSPFRAVWHFSGEGRISSPVGVEMGDVMTPEPELL